MTEAESAPSNAANSETAKLLIDLCLLPVAVEISSRLLEPTQGSHASWKVRNFFLENSSTWTVLENHFGPGKSWKFKLKVLEIPGKNMLESHAFF